MFGTSGIRGPVGDQVTGALALDLGRALGATSDRVVVGRDVRESGDALARAAIAGIQEAGSNVIDVGVESTPTIARSVRPLDADAGLVVTASHNPPADNGFKCWSRDASAFDADEIEALEAVMAESQRATVPADEMGTVRTVEHARADHRDRLPTDGLDASVVVDVGTGTGQVTSEALRAGGCAVHTLDADRDGRFPARPSEPTAETCGTLAALVGATDADLGVAHDGDADRMMAVDETGRFVSGDELLGVFASATPPGSSVAAPINASALVEDVTDGAVVRTAVGDGAVAEATRQPEVAFGGEPSGAWIWPAETYCPDGHLAACRLVQLVTQGPSLAERVAALPSYATRRASIECADKRAVMDAVEAGVRERFDDVTDVDGVRVDLSDGWFLIRASGTQPLVRVTAEAETDARADAVFDEARSIVEEAVEPPVIDGDD
ncbi:phosphopentomutase/phosphoglucosamine mutase [Halococcoides cellulosivorans]|uniref:Phosphoglucosamine mutase n=1 Tax=Halococcoides cellulosivorans TaxID=1679096 RepID=A0A2R4X3G7_9EURY|nr:phosphopentomutase/phosphoglucosamine mutase [Halococcoides cellulosivorans]AWB28337.1 phosphoglucosamine mutase [Halococcoides cellulosivorans]